MAKAIDLGGSTPYPLRKTMTFRLVGEREPKASLTVRLTVCLTA